jgi:glycosyltransferase involved in cell wall biosynthesis
MKVLHILNELKPSGAETMLFVGAEYFKKEKIESHILATGVNEGVYASQLRLAGYVIHHIPFRASLGFLRNLVRMMRNLNFSVIHIHSERANFWIGLACILARPKKIIRTIHNVFAVAGWLRVKRKIQRRILSWGGVKHVAIGESVKNNEFEIFRNKTVIVPNWYNSMVYERCTSTRKLEIKGRLGIIFADRPIMISVGNCSVVKNHEAIIHAMAEIDEAQRPYYIHVGTEDVEGSERRLVSNFGLEEDVLFVGAVQNVVEYLWVADIFIMPSLNEGFSIAALEAIATGLLCVVSDVVGLKDLKKDFPGLIFMKSTNYQGVKAGVMDACERLRGGNLYNNDPEICKKKYSPECGVMGYIDLYKS